MHKAYKAFQVHYMLFDIQNTLEEADLLIFKQEASACEIN